MYSRAFPAPAIAGLLLLSPPLGAWSAHRPSYRVDRNWPQVRRQAVPAYSDAKVSGVAIDAQGNVLLFQRAEVPVLVFDRHGRFLRSWGRGMFEMPHGLRVDPEGNIWTTDLHKHQVMKFSPEGELLQTWGEEGVPGDDLRHFNMPADIAFGRNGEVYVADGYGNHRVVVISRDGEIVGDWGTLGTGPGQFTPTVHSIATDARGRVYVADRGNFRVQVFTPEGRYITQWPQMGYVNGLHVTKDQKMLVVEGTTNTVRMYDLRGRLLGRWGGYGHRAGRMYGPHMVCSDDHGDIYVAEISTRRAQKFVRR